MSADAADPDTRAVIAAQVVARRHGIACTEPQVLASGYSLVVHLAPAPVVARIPTIYARLRSAAGRTREIELVSWLHRHGAPVVPPSDQLPPGPHEHDGWWMTFWQYTPPSNDVPVTTAELGPHLAELHTIMRDYPGDLPLMGPAAQEIPACLSLLDHDPGFLTDAQLDVLHAAHRRLGPLLTTPTQPVQPVHGDAFPGNTVRTRDGLRWIDFEDACAAPIAWDLANLLDSDAPQALDTYPEAPPLADIEPYAELRALQVATWLAAAPPPRGGRDGIRQMTLSILERWT